MGSDIFFPHPSESSHMCLSVMSGESCDFSLPRFHSSLRPHEEGGRTPPLSTDLRLPVFVHSVTEHLGCGGLAGCSRGTGEDQAWPPPSRTSRLTLTLPPLPGWRLRVPADYSAAKPYTQTGCMWHRCNGQEEISKQERPE